jgi:uncharacterized coiled-coil protein SlyX
MSSTNRSDHNGSRGNWNYRHWKKSWWKPKLKLIDGIPCLKDTPELSSELSARIEQLEITYYTHKQRIQELNRILEVEGYKIKKEDTKKVLELVNAQLSQLE